MVYSVQLLAYWCYPKFAFLISQLGKVSPPCSTQKTYLQESINFHQPWSNLWKTEKKREREEKKKKMSLKLSERSNFYHLQCTFLPPRSPLNVKWQGRTQGPGHKSRRMTEWRRVVPFGEMKKKGAGEAGTAPLAGLMRGHRGGLWPLYSWCPMPKPSVGGPLLPPSAALLSDFLRF